MSYIFTLSIKFRLALCSHSSPASRSPALFPNNFKMQASPSLYTRLQALQHLQLIFKAKYQDATAKRDL